MTTGERLDSIDEKLDLLVTEQATSNEQLRACHSVVMGNGQRGVIDRLARLDTARTIYIGAGSAGLLAIGQWVLTLVTKH